MNDLMQYQQNLGGMETALGGFRNRKLRDYGNVQSAYEKAAEVAKTGFDKQELLSKTLMEAGAGGIGVIEGGKGLFKLGKKIYSKWKSKGSKDGGEEDEDLANDEPITEDYDIGDLTADTTSGIEKGTQEVGEVVSKAVSKVGDTISDLGETAIDGVKSAINNVGEFGQNTLKSAINGVKSKFQSAQSREAEMQNEFDSRGSSENSGFGDKTDPDMGKGNIEMSDMNRTTNMTDEKVYDQEGNEIENAGDTENAIEGTDITLDETETTATDVGTDLGSDIATDTAVTVGEETGAELAGWGTEEAVSAAMDWNPIGWIGTLIGVIGAGVSIGTGVADAVKAANKLKSQDQAAEDNEQQGFNRVAQMNPAGHYATPSLNALHTFQQ